MLALEHHRKADLCHLCGMPKKICRAYEADGQVYVESERCHVAAAIARKRKADENAEIPMPETLAYSASFNPPDWAQ